MQKTQNTFVIRTQTERNRMKLLPKVESSRLLSERSEQSLVNSRFRFANQTPSRAKPPTMIAQDLTKLTGDGPSKAQSQSALNYFSTDSYMFLSAYEEKVLSYRETINSIKDLMTNMKKTLKKNPTVQDLKVIVGVLDRCDSLQAQKLIIGSYKLVTIVLFEFKETQKCLEILKTFKGVARWFEDLSAEMFAYELMGKCMNSLFRFKEAEDCFSKMLRFAFFIGDSKAEPRVNTRWHVA